MILQALAELCERRWRDPDPTRRLPSPGLEDKEIPFVVELRADGTVVQIRDTRTRIGKKLRGKTYLVPQAAKKTVNVVSNLLWDTAEYALGTSVRANPSRLHKQQLAFKQRVQELAERAPEDEGLQAVLKFLADPKLDAQRDTPVWDDIVKNNELVSFELQGDGGGLICERPAVVLAVRSAAGVSSDAVHAMCLVEGKVLPIARLHAAIKGVFGGQSSGTNIVSFNFDASNSYGKVQGGNAPVSARAALAYTKALNDLLDRNSRNRVQVGDSSTVFWADGESKFDSEFTLADFFGEPKVDNPDRGRSAVSALYQSMRSGHFPVEEANVRFFVLGLAPNGARISVRFWLPGLPFSELAPRIARYFDDVRLVRQFDRDPEHPSLLRLLCGVALQGKADNVPPRLAGEWMRSILEGLPLPALLLNSAVIRERAERVKSDDFLAAGRRRMRMCIFKLVLNQAYRREHPEFSSDYQHFKENLSMSQAEPPYRLGRLFATLERIQGVAQPGINATIRDRYYAAASTTPVAVFTTLLRLKNAHIKKLAAWQSISFEKLIAEILEPISPDIGFPRQLSLPEQGQFALGYYHQRQAFYAKRPDDNQEAKEA